MKKNFILLIVVLCFLTFGISRAKQTQVETGVINIEVPVRVFSGNNFVDGLTMADFQIFENGKLQKIDALYFVKNVDIQRSEGEIPISPQTGRYFVLSFILTEYLPSLNDVVGYFLEQVYQTEDTLVLVTPLNTYHLSPDAVRDLPKDRLKEDILGILRKDILLGSTEYSHAIDEIEAAAKSGDANQYYQAMKRLEALRYIDQNKLIEVSHQLKAQEGQKHVFLFYQREMVPHLQPGNLTGTDVAELDGVLPSSALPTTYFEDIVFDVDIVKESFSDSSTTIHFLYVKDPLDRNMRRLHKGIGNTKFVEKSGDIFNAFREMAKTTGGLTEVSSNIPLIFKKAVDASENYYLLYYTPKDYQADGKYKKISVKVKGNKAQITHRAGYISN